MAYIFIAAVAPSILAFHAIRAFFGAAMARDFTIKQHHISGRHVAAAYIDDAIFHCAMMVLLLVCAKCRRNN